MTALHVAVEGLDGSGKSTLIEEVLRRAGIPTRVFHLPDPNHLCGPELRAAVSLVRNPDPPEVMALAFAANRLSQRAEIATIGDSHLVISDRDLLSGYVYQALQGVDAHWLRAINSKCSQPDLTVFLDTSPEVCRTRIRARSGPAELFERDFDQTRLLFLEEVEVAERAGCRVLRLDGSDSPDALAKRLLGALVDR